MSALMFALPALVLCRPEPGFAVNKSWQDAGVSRKRFIK